MKANTKDLKVAIVYDRINKWGGAERVLLALHELWPEAPFFTAMYDPKGAPWAADFDIRPSFLNALPFARSRHELFPWATPLAFETFDFTGYDVVISVTSADAKGIITKPETLHVCYCLTPTRYLWSGYDEYLRHPGFGGPLASSILKVSSPMMRKWDFISAQRPDRYIAISDMVAGRIRKYYGRDVDRIIYPPVDTDMFVPGPAKDDGYYLTVSRLVGYKRVDLVVDAATRLDLPLVVIGSGSEEKNLRSRAGNKIRFISDHLTDGELLGYHQSCRAFVFAGQEDFGIVAGEAQACGKPVIAFRHSGIAEIVEEGVTGFLFDEQSVDSVVKALKASEHLKFNPKKCRNQALKFSKRRFLDTMKTYITDTVAAYTKENA